MEQVILDIPFANELGRNLFILSDAFEELMRLLSPSTRLQMSIKSLHFHKFEVLYRGSLL